MAYPPVVVAATQATLLAALSNILGQLIDNHRANRPMSFDGVHFFNFVVLSIILSPPNFFWQAFLERTFPGRKHTGSQQRYDADIDLEDQRKRDSENLLASDPLSSPNTSSASGTTFERISRNTSDLNVRNTVIKWFIDCITVGAILNTVAFLALLGLLKHKTFAEIGQDIRTQTWPIIYAGYAIWPLASIINFTFVPVEKRIVWLSFVGLWWGAYLSIVAANV